MAGSNLRWLTIADFRPGVFRTRASFADADAPLGAASVAIGCLASATGELIAGPSLTDTITQAPFEAHGGDTHYWPAAADRRYQLCASHLVSPITNQSLVAPDTAFSVPIAPDQLFVSWQYFYDSTGATNYAVSSRTRSYRLYVDPSGASSFDIETTALRGALPLVGDYLTGWADFASGGQVSPTGGVVPFDPVGHQVVLIRRLGRIADAAGYSYPKAPFDTDAIFTNTNVNGVLLAAHQDRFVWATAFLPEFGLGAGGTGTFNLVFNDLDLSDLFDFEDTNITPLILDTSNLSGITVLASVNAGELFYVKATDGGGKISGDLFAPQVTSLRTVHPTGQVYVKPAITPFGVMYVGQNGVYLWAGGDASQKISQQLDSRLFWEPTGVSSALGFHGQCAYYDPWLLVPGNWIYDTRHQSWWQLDGGTEGLSYFSYHPSASGKVYALPAFISATQTILARRLDFHNDPRAFKYSWTSAPLNPATARAGTDYAQHLGDQDRRIHKLRSVEISARARGANSSISVQVFGDNGATDIHAIAIDNTDSRYRTYRADFAIDGYTFQIALVATSDATAPSVAELRLGFEDTGSIPDLST